MARIETWLGGIAIGLMLSWFVLSMLITGFMPIFVPHTTYLSSKLFPLSGWYSGLDFGFTHSYAFYPANTSSNTSCIEYAVWHKTINTFNYTTQTSHSYTENITINNSAQLDSIYAKATAESMHPISNYVGAIYSNQGREISIPPNHTLLCPNKSKIPDRQPSLIEVEFYKGEMEAD